MTCPKNPSYIVLIVASLNFALKNFGGLLICEKLIFSLWKKYFQSKMKTNKNGEKNMNFERRVDFDKSNRSYKWILYCERFACFIYQNKFNT